MEFGGLSTVNRQRKIYKAINHKNGKVYLEGNYARWIIYCVS